HRCLPDALVDIASSEGHDPRAVAAAAESDRVVKGRLWSRRLRYIELLEHLSGTRRAIGTVRMPALILGWDEAALPHLPPDRRCPPELGKDLGTRVVPRRQELHEVDERAVGHLDGGTPDTCDGFIRGLRPAHPRPEEVLELPPGAPPIVPERPPGQLP